MSEFVTSPGISDTDPALTPKGIDLPGNKPEYEFQTLEEYKAGIKFLEVSPDDPEFEEAEKVGVPAFSTQKTVPIPVSGLTSEQKQFLEDQLDGTSEGLFAAKDWWLDPRSPWAEKLAEGRLTEQIRFSYNGLSVDLYSFRDEQLTERDVQRLQKAIQGLFELLGDKLPQVCPTIIFDNDYQRESFKKDEEPEPFSAVADEIHDVIIVNDGALVPTITAAPGLSWLEEVVVHEYGHMLVPVFHLIESDFPIGREWLELGDWERTDGGKWHNKNLNLPSTYAYTNPLEDFAESFVAFMYRPRDLDPGRREFITEHFFDGATQNSPIEVTCQRLTGKDILLPKKEPFTRKYYASLYYYSLGPERDEKTKKYLQEAIDFKVKN